MRRSHSVRVAFLLRRMRANQLLLGCVLLVALVTATLLAALADFAAVTLTQAAEQQVSASAEFSVQVSSTASAAQAAPAGRFIRASLRSAFGPQGLAMSDALWSDPLDLPTPPGAGSQPIAEIARLGGVTAHTRLIAGTWPRPSSAGSPYGVAVPVTDVRLLGLRLGQLLPLTDADNGSAVTARITGIYEIDDPTARYWALSLVSTAGVTAQPGFRTYGPFLAGPGTLGPGGRLTVGQRSWLAEPLRSTVPPGSMGALALRVQQAVTNLGQAQGFGGIVTSTSLPELLSGTVASYEVARSLLVVDGLELLLVATAAIALAARLLAGQREPESALLAARGLTRRQVRLLALAEAVAAAAVAGAAGVVLGALLARLLTSLSGSLRGVGQAGPALGRASLETGWRPALIVVLLTALVLAWPAPGSATAAAAGARSGRPAIVATASRVGADVAIVVLAALTGWQLRRYSAVAHSSSGVLGVDPVLVVAPALILTALALIPLRLLPAVTRRADRLAARGRRLTTALAAWQLSRLPIRQAGPALLAILAVGTSTLAMSEELSWHQSVRAQAAMTVGADARIDVPPSGGGSARIAGIVDARDVRAAMPVTAFDGGLPGQVIALEARSAASVVQLRPDQAGRPAGQLWRLLIPPARPEGTRIPGRPLRIGVEARLGRAPAAWDLGPLAVSLSVQAADGVVYAVPAGLLPPDGASHLLTAAIPAADRASYPLRLVGVTLAYQMPPVPALAAEAAVISDRQVSLTVGGFVASADTAGPLARFALGAALAGWRSAAMASTLAAAKGASVTRPAIGDWHGAAAGGLTAAFSPGDGQYVPPEGSTPLPISAAVTLTARPGISAIPGIATASFAAASGSGVGATVVAVVGDYHVPVHIVAEVPSFPTVGGGSALITDQGAVQALLAGVAAPPLNVTSWWLSTTAGGPPTGSGGDVPVVSLRQVAAAMLDNPIDAAPQQATLAIAAAVALLATLGFAVSVWASLTERRAANAVLAALGVSRRSRARQLCLEQAMLAAPAAAVGLLAGAAIARLLIPAVTLTATAAKPIPPALVYLPLGWALALAAVVAVIPVLAAAATVVSRLDPASELRATGTA